MDQKLFFQNSKGNKLCGLLSNSTGDISRPIIILVHGFSSNKNTSNFVKLKDILDKDNIATFRFDVFGHGESEGKFEDITISEAVDDILRTIKFLQSKGYKRIGLLGSSFGGISSIMAASKTNDLFMLALKSPVSDYLEVEMNRFSKKDLEEWRKQGYRDYEDDGKILKLGYTFIADFENNDAYKAATQIGIPTLIVHGDADDVVPVSQSVKTSLLIPNCKLVLIKGANHRYTEGDQAEQMLKAFSEFITSEASKI
jgi:hypothetical protein